LAVCLRLQDAKPPQQHAADDDDCDNKQRNVVFFIVTVASGRVESHLLLQELVKIVVVYEFFNVDITVGEHTHMF